MLQQQQPQTLPSKPREGKQRRPDREVYVPRGRRLLAETQIQPTNNVESQKDKSGVKRSHDKNFCNIYKPPHVRACDESVKTISKDEPEPEADEVKSVVFSEVIQEQHHQDDVDSHPDPPPDLGHIDNLAHDLEERLTPPITMEIESHEIIPIESRTYNTDKDEDGEQKEFQRATEEINRSNRRLIKQSFDSDVLIISDPIQAEPPKQLSIDEVERLDPSNNKFNPDEDEWESMFDDNEDCLEPGLLAELTAAVGRVSVHRPRVPVSPGTDNFAHVLELYNFPAAFTTVDLHAAFAEFKDKGFEIKWVDDTHALAVFSSPKIAADVLAMSHSMIKTRPLQEGTPASKIKAKKCAEFLQPYRQRPETCPALARRLVTGALGVKLATAKQERIEERRVLTEAREKKKLAAKNREAAWEGTIPNQTN